ncbi:[2Fe-2S]-binding domain protein [Heyndrickxia coagulans]|uniref:[2Fe-2S]-binding domain protein n=1 Tax=Heyndrickxia coagulans TaxID=1398 RepID=A0A133KBJ8_HEYCO|nr:[2Fe-2S]-binding domain protein [Heyndrickxia coagulans]
MEAVILNEETIICPCEDVTYSDLESVLSLGAETFDDVKRFTRCGMGSCQAKACFYQVSKLISKRKQIPLSKIPYTHMRLPLRMIPLESLLGEDKEKPVKTSLSEGHANE